MDVLGHKLEKLGLTDGPRRVLEDFTRAAVTTLADDLKAVVLFGSAAEGRLRPTSDLNVVLVLARFDGARMSELQGPLRLAHAAALRAMFLLEGEIPHVAESFANKLADILQRRVVLHGDDPFASVAVPRAALQSRIKQIFLNVALRLRQAYVLGGDRDDTMAEALSEAAGPIRTAAATLLELEGQGRLAPREALERAAGPERAALLQDLTRARQGHTLDAGVAARRVLELVDLAGILRARAERTPS